MNEWDQGFPLWVLEIQDILLPALLVLFSAPPPILVCFTRIFNTHCCLYHGLFSLLALNFPLLSLFFSFFPFLTSQTLFKSTFFFGGWFIRMKQVFFIFIWGVIFLLFTLHMFLEAIGSGFESTLGKFVIWRGLKDFKFRYGGSFCRVFFLGLGLCLRFL